MSDTIVELQEGSTVIVNGLYVCTIQICSHFAVVGADAVSVQESSDSPSGSAVGSGISASPTTDGVKDRSELHRSHVSEAETEAKTSNDDPSEHDNNARGRLLT